VKRALIPTDRKLCAKTNIHIALLTQDMSNAEQTRHKPTKKQWHGHHY